MEEVSYSNKEGRLTLQFNEGAAVLYVNADGMHLTRQAALFLSATLHLYGQELREEKFDPREVREGE